ncbi:MAG: hypothetical protein CMF49_07625 [Legionellales bacterium]|nr:hypothetical protein [Legionellales bacterium]
MPTLTNKCYETSLSKLTNKKPEELPECKDFSIKAFAEVLNKDLSEADALHIPEGLEEALKKHIGEQSNYSLIKQLKAACWRVYQYLKHSDMSLKERASLVVELCEDIQECTQGFHERISSFLLKIQRPVSIDDYLRRIKLNIIQEIAAEMSRSRGYHKNRQEGKHLHTIMQNYAHTEKMGVPDSSTKQCYDIAFNDRDKRDFKDAFNKKYNALNLLIMLQTEIERELEAYYDYKGFNEKGYESVVYEKIITHLKKLLGKKVTYGNIFLLKNDKLVDINYLKLQKFSFEKLRIDQYINFTELEQKLFEAIYSEEAKLFQDYLDSEGGIECIKALRLFSYEALFNAPSNEAKFNMLIARWFSDEENKNQFLQLPERKSTLVCRINILSMASKKLIKSIFTSMPMTLTNIYVLAAYSLVAIENKLPLVDIFLNILSEQDEEFKTAYFTKYHSPTRKVSILMQVMKFFPEKLGVFLAQISSLSVEKQVEIFSYITPMGFNIFNILQSSPRIGVILAAPINSWENNKQADDMIRQLIATIEKLPLIAQYKISQKMPQNSSIELFIEYLNNFQSNVKNKINALKNSENEIDRTIFTLINKLHYNAEEKQLCILAAYHELKFNSNSDNLLNNVSQAVNNSESALYRALNMPRAPTLTFLNSLFFTQKETCQSLQLIKTKLEEHKRITNAVN